MTGTQIFAFVALPILIGAVACVGVFLNDRGMRRANEKRKRGRAV